MFQLFKKDVRKIGGLLLGVQIFLVFLVPVNVAQAAATTKCALNIVTIWGCMADNAGILASNIGAIGHAIAHPLDTAGEAAMSLVVYIASLIFQLAQYFFISMAYVLDFAISATISSASYKISTILVAWTAVRDLSNMFFIFVLLFIAIQTILGLAGGSAKRWLSHVIIAALLINFSLFLTGVVIDAGNVLAMGFWDKMTSKQAGVTAPSASMQLMQGLKLQTAAGAMDASGKPIEQDPSKQLLAYVGGILVTLVAGYVFLAGAVMMIIRTVTLMILMIASPFAFLGFALPKGGGFANTWLQKLIGNTFVAPAFLAMLYIDTLIINTDLSNMTGADGSQLGAAFSGTWSAFPVIYHYVLIIILILASLTVANQVSSGAGSAGGAMAKRIIGGGAAAGFAGAGWYGRQTIGSTAHNKLQDEEWVKEQNRKIAEGGKKNATFRDKFAARTANVKLATAERAAKGSFDIRNAPMGGLGVTAALGKAGINTGTGSKKSFETHGETGSWATGNYRGTEKEKELIAIAKARFPNDPVAQKAYLSQRGVELDKERNKDTRTEIDRKIATEAEKTKIKDNTAAYEKAKEDGTLDKIITEQGKDQGKTIGEAAADAIKESMGKLSGKEAENLIKTEAAKVIADPKHQSLVLAAAGKQHLTYMNANPADFTPEIMRVTNDQVMASDNENGRQYLIQQQKMKTGVFPTSLKDELGKRLSNYPQERAEILALPETTPELAERKREILHDFDDKHDSAIQDILGGMSVKEVARLEDKLKSDKSLVRNYTEKHFNEIESYHKNIANDADTAEKKTMFATMRKHAEEDGTKSTRKYMNEAKKKSDSVFFDRTAANNEPLFAEIKTKHEQAKRAVTDAELKLAEAKASGVVWRKNEAQKNLVDAKEQEEKAAAEVAKQKKEPETSSDSGSNDEDDEGEEVV